MVNGNLIADKGEKNHIGGIEVLERKTDALQISSKGYRAKDITTQFTKAASALPNGHLIKDEYFTLFEAVGALEIMDPKMDSGYLAPGETLEDDYDVLKELLPEEVIGIMDQLLCYEMAWHMGYPLSQSLFTSLYLDRLLWPEPKNLEEATFSCDSKPQNTNMLLHLVLQAYCLALIKTCSLVHGRITEETYYEEEDFVTNLYNRKLLADFETAHFENLLTSAIEWITDQEAAGPDSLNAAIIIRLNFRKTFLQAISLDADVVSQQKQNHLWEECISSLPQVRKSHESGLSVESAFSSKIQRRLASTVPPRPIVDISFNDAYNHLERLCKDGKDVARVLECNGGSNILTFVLCFQSRKPQPSVYIRCLLQSLIFGGTKVLGTMPIDQFIFEDLAEIVLPADVLVSPRNNEVEAPQDYRFQIARRMRMFVLRVGQSYLDISRALTMNRSRMRRMLCHTIIDWDNIQIDAEELDTELRQYTKEEPIVTEGEEVWAFPLSSWAYYQKLHQMEWIVQLGFELHIYRVNEMPGMYWYLQQLANTRLQHLERIRGFTIRRQRALLDPDIHQKATLARSYSFLSFAMLEASATQSFADGLSYLYLSLSHLSLLPSVSAPYSTPFLRHALRMRPFLSISFPKAPLYTDFASLTSPSSSSPCTCISSSPKPCASLTHLLTLAERALKCTSNEWGEVSKASAESARCVGCEKEWKGSVRNVRKSVIAGNLAVAAVRGWLKDGGKGRLAVEVKGREDHDWWAVPSVSLVSAEQK